MLYKTFERHVKKLGFKTGVSKGGGLAIIDPCNHNTYASVSHIDDSYSIYTNNIGKLSNNDQRKIYYLVRKLAYTPIEERESQEAFKIATNTYFAGLVSTDVSGMGNDYFKKVVLCMSSAPQLLNEDDRHFAMHYLIGKFVDYKN